MGSEKGLVDLGGRPMALYPLSALGEICDEVFVVANSSEYELLGVPVIPDLRPGLGPVAGIEAGLEASANDAAVVVACDMPFADAQLLLRLAGAALAAGSDAAAPVGPRGPEPCMAAYNRSALGVVRRMLDEGALRATSLLDALDTAYLTDLSDGELASLTSVNTPEAVSDAEELLRARGG